MFCPTYIFLTLLKFWLHQQVSSRNKGKVTNIRIELSSRTAETLLSLYIPEHSSIFPINHLGEFFKKAFIDKAVQDMKLHGTKCGEMFWVHILYQLSKQILVTVIIVWS